MKYLKLNIIKILSRSGDLLRLERKMREERVNVITIPGGGKSPDKGTIRPWKPLPSISEFECKLSLYDWLFLIFGYSKRYKPTLECKQWKNNSANRYIDYMFKRLSKQVSLGKFNGAGKTMWVLMRSSAYQTCCFNYVLKNWHRELKWSHVKIIMKELKTLCEWQATRIKYYRVYLKEPNKVRPLGVPTLAWRVYLHMYNNLIVQWRLVSEGEKQHAYLPRRGVITAWERLIDRLTNAPNIYEADYQGFFNNITHRAIAEELWKMGLPKYEIEIAMKLNKSLPILQNEDLIMEPDREVIWEGEDELNLQASKEALSKAFTTNREGLWSISDKRKEAGVPQGAATSCSYATLVLRHIERFLDVLIYADDVIWFPKKATEDPSCLEDVQRGIILQRSKSGWAKRNHVWEKEYTQFLGIRYYPARGEIPMDFWSIMWLLIPLDLFVGVGPIFTGTWCLIWLRDRNKRLRPILRAATRKGSTLEFTSKEGFLTYLNNARTNLLNTSSREELRGNMLSEWLMKHAKEYKYFWVSSLFRDTTAEYSTSPLSSTYRAKWGPRLKGEVAHIPITGWLFSRMQLGKWNHELERKQNFKLTYSDKSWLSLCWRRYAWKHILPVNNITVFTASSFASNDLLDYCSRTKANVR